MKELDFESSASTIPPQGHAARLASERARRGLQTVHGASERPRVAFPRGMKTADFFVDRLKAWGVKRIFGYSGDGINGVIGALQRDGGKSTSSRPRHEEMAAFMAVAHAKFTGELGVCLATGGPGATHLITGLYDAKLDHMPVLAICGPGRDAPSAARAISRSSISTGSSPTSPNMFRRSAMPAQLRACHRPRDPPRARRARAPSVIIIPKTCRSKPFEAPQRAHGFTRSGSGYSRPLIVPARSRPA